MFLLCGPAPAHHHALLLRTDGHDARVKRRRAHVHQRVNRPQHDGHQQHARPQDDLEVPNARVSESDGCQKKGRARECVERASCAGKKPAKWQGPQRKAGRAKGTTEWDWEPRRPVRWWRLMKRARARARRVKCNVSAVEVRDFIVRSFAVEWRLCISVVDAARTLTHFPCALRKNAFLILFTFEAARCPCRVF